MCSIRIRKPVFFQSKTLKEVLMYYLGIDISKKSFTVSVLDEEGEAISKVLTFLCTG